MTLLSAETALRRVLQENPALGPLLPGARQEQLLRYWGLLERWGAAVNLSRRSGPEDWARADVADAFLGLAAAKVEALSPDELAMDVGSGGGFPALALALLRQGPVRWIEPSMRRVSFLQRVVRELSLSHVEVEAARVETVGAPAAVVTSRATFPWQELHRLGPVVAPRGVMVAFVGREPDATAWSEQVEGWGWRGARLPYDVVGLGTRAVAMAWRERFHVEPPRGGA